MTKLKAFRRRGFSLVELLVTIGIIALLIGITLPIVSRVRDSARGAATQAFLNQLSGAIERYYQDFHAYPGPLADNQIYTTSNSTTPAFGPAFTNFQFSPTETTNGYDSSVGTDTTRFTAAENLVLGLLGGLTYTGTSGNYILTFDPTFVGKGPISLNPLNPKQYTAYADTNNLFQRQINGLKTGKYQDDSAAADDTQIPEFTDTFIDPLPILYLRARRGAQLSTPTATPSDGDNLVITDGTGNRGGPYDISQIKAYVASFSGGSAYTGNAPVTGNYASIGVGKKFKEFTDISGNRIVPSPQYHGLWKVDEAQAQAKVRPYNAYEYFLDPSSTANNPQPRAKDRYILISAGPDRVYGTPDDITSFGSVGQ